jgi:DDE superfamily endonuclease
VVLCVDEKSGMQALDRSQPVLPMMPGMPQRQTPDYVRHGTTSLFAAFNIADGSVISELHRQHRAVEFRKFLVAIDKAVPADLDVHLICDNLATHKTPAIGRLIDGTRGRSRQSRAEHLITPLTRCGDASSQHRRSPSTCSTEHRDRRRRA